jgi:short-subunit dehydrogenase
LGFSPGVIPTAFHKTAGSSVAAFPRVLVQSAESAAAELVAALRKRTAPRVISGFATRLMIRLHRLVSRKTAISMMGTSSPIRESA